MACDLDRPAWFELVQTPAVVGVLTILHRDGSCSHASLCVHVSTRAKHQDAAAVDSALRLLVAYELVRRDLGTGSWDHPAPDTRWDLTSRGHQFARLWQQLTRIIAAHQATTARPPKRRGLASPEVDGYS